MYCFCAFVTSTKCVISHEHQCNRSTLLAFVCFNLVHCCSLLQVATNALLSLLTCHALFLYNTTLSCVHIP